MGKLKKIKIGSTLYNISDPSIEPLELTLSGITWPIAANSSVTGSVTETAKWGKFTQDTYLQVVGYIEYADGFGSKLVINSAGSSYQLWPVYANDTKYYVTINVSSSGPTVSISGCTTAINKITLFKSPQDTNIFSVAYTKSEIDTKIGNINTILESIV